VQAALAQADARFSAREPQLRWPRPWPRPSSRSALVAEAGTGVGKTFAYLVPALLSGAAPGQHRHQEPAGPALPARLPRLRDALQRR
jgi:ATP-dependent DNA helicase DinG